MKNYDYILAKSEEHGKFPLKKHLNDVAMVAVSVAQNLGMNTETAWKGAILHDIGKVSPLFQQTLKPGFIRSTGFIFRHEIASLFFISLVKEEEKNAVIEMIAAHHKSIYNDVSGKGFLDLDENIKSFEIHSNGFEKWSLLALNILKQLGFKTHTISLNEAQENYKYTINYCTPMRLKCSEWKGLLMSADHFSSALVDQTELTINKLFIKPDLSFYYRHNELYPLSNISSTDKRRHTIVTAPTGAGKTDFLFRRCSDRVFYTLPYQASINAMYDRIKSDLKETEAQIHLLHAASFLKIKDGKLEESILQKQIGASIKVLTPHQIASVVFGIKGYESMVLDLKNCDVILDEIHTYSDTIQAIVLKIVEILIALNCRIHIGTATMPSILYDKLLNLLGGSDNVYEVSLPENILKSFNRHIIHKCDNFESMSEIINSAVNEKKKILIVCNQVKRSQQTFKKIKEKYPSVPKMLIHSRYKRIQRQKLETELKQRYNLIDDACIVVSTQVVEVSLDISFDLMITECASIDALIQRFGRINRKRALDTIGKYKPIYIIKPPLDKSDTLPYDIDILYRSFAVLPDNQLLEETEIQNMLDTVYNKIGFLNIDMNAVFSNNKWQIKELCHNSKSALLDTLDINSAVCITESDKEKYLKSSKNERTEMEIPVSFCAVGYNKLEKLEEGMHPLVIPEKAYSKELGLLIEYAKPEYYKTFELL